MDAAALRSRLDAILVLLALTVSLLTGPRLGTDLESELVFTLVSFALVSSLVGLSVSVRSGA